MSKKTFGARPRTMIALAIAAILTGTGAQAATIEGPGLTHPGTITYDAAGIPTVTGATDEDAAWLMGYAHARTRFFQMATLRRGARGTVAELVGSAGLAQDLRGGRGAVDERQQKVLGGDVLVAHPLRLLPGTAQHVAVGGGEL